MRIEIPDEEIGMLMAIAEEHISDLRSEIHRTTNLNYKKELKEKEAIINRFLERLRNTRTTAATGGILN